MPLHVLIATIPERKWSVEPLLASLPQQTAVIDCLHLSLDGYGDAPGPQTPSGITVREWRTPKKSGPGSRWRILRELPPETTVVVLDDDVNISKQPEAIERLGALVKPGVSAGTGMGMTVEGNFLLWGHISGCAMSNVNGGSCAVSSADLHGLQEMRDSILVDEGIDLLGNLGADEDLVSACLQLNNIIIGKAFLPGMFMNPSASWDEHSQSAQSAHHPGIYERQRDVLRRRYGYARAERARNL